MKKNIITALSVLTGMLVGSVSTGVYQNKIVQAKQEKIDKFKSYYNMLNQWLILKQEGKNLEQYFIDNGYKNIAIYGMGEMGNRLYDELKETSINISYAIDKEAGFTYSEIEVYELEDTLPEVDVVIITAIFAIDKIESDLEGKINCEIRSLEDVVYEI